MLAFEFPTLISYVSRIKEEYLGTPLVAAASSPSSSFYSTFCGLFQPPKELSPEEEEKVKEGRLESFKRISFAFASIAFFVAFVVKRDSVKSSDEEE